MKFSDMIRDPKQYIVSEETRHNIAANIAIIELRNAELAEALDSCRGQWIHSVNAEKCLKALAKYKGK